ALPDRTRSKARPVSEGMADVRTVELIELTKNAASSGQLTSKCETIHRSGELRSYWRSPVTVNSPGPERLTVLLNDIYPPDDERQSIPRGQAAAVARPQGRL